MQDSGFKKINNSKKRPIITHHVAHGPKRVNVRILPNHIKQKIVDYYSTCINEFKAEFPEDIAKSAENILNSIAKYMNDADYSDKLAEFVRFTKYLDSARDQNIVEVVPEYRELIDENF